MANTFNLGNGNWAQKTEKLLAYNAENNNYKPLPFDFDRASTATRVNKQGLIETVGVDEPRIDFLNNTKGHLLLEPSRENKFLQSNQFDTTWISDQVTVTSGQTGVGGSTDAWLLTATSGTGEKKIRQSSPLSGNVAVSVYAKKGTNNYLWLRGVTSGFAIVTWFDLENGQVATDNAVSSEMIDMGNGWYRCIAVFNQDAGWDFHIGNSNQDNQRSVNTTGTIYIQYSQSELGSYATSYIPTSGSAVTRSAETCNNAGNSTVFNGSEGVLYAEISANENVSGRWISLSNGTTNERISIAFQANDIRLYIKNTSGLIWDYTYTSANIFNYNKIGLKYKSGDYALWINGIEVATDSNSNLASNLSVLQFDSGGGSSNFYGNVKDVRVYNTALTDAELIALTS